MAHQYFADQLTLFQPFRHHCFKTVFLKSSRTQSFQISRTNFYLLEQILLKLETILENWKDKVFDRTWGVYVYFKFYYNIYVFKQIADQIAFLAFRFWV